MKRKNEPTRRTIAPPKLKIDQTFEGALGAPVEDHAAIERTALLDGDLSDIEVTGLLLDQIRFTRVLLSRGHLSAPEVIDARLEACDLAGAEWEKARLTRVELVGCRLTGARMIDATVDDLVATESNLEMGIFWNARFRGVRFERCLLRGASFEGADLAGAIFRGCDLTGADFRNTKLEGTDFRGSSIVGLRIGASEIRGTIIDPMQAVDLVHLLGVRVEVEEE